MLIFFDARLVLLSVPKTGTTAYQEALGARADLVLTGPPALKHATLYRYHRFIRPIYEKVCGVELEVAAVMREPVSWLGSWYRYRQRSSLKDHPNSTEGIGFDAFVQAYCDDQTPAFANVGRQEKFLEPHPKGKPLDHIFAYEDQGLFQAFLSERLGPLPKIERLNVSPDVPVSLSEDVDMLLRRKHRKAFDLYASI